MNRLHTFHRSCWFKAGLLLVAFLAAPGLLTAQIKFTKGRPKPSQIQQSLDDYLERARASASDQPRTLGSLWTPAAPMAMTASDYKARLPGDLLIINVSDNFSSTNTGNAQQQRSLSASSSVASSLITNNAFNNHVSNLFSPTSAYNMSGKGQTALTSTLSLNLSARVVETLPNGVLVVEAVRDFTIGNDRQTIVLHGLVRPGDIAADNSVPSSAVANLEAEVHGKGAVADSIRQPNSVIRFLLKIFNF